MQMQISTQEKRMSSSQFSELLGYTNKEINKKIREMFVQEIAREKISLTLDAQGRISEYYLPEVESNMLVAKWDINHLRTISSYFIQKPMTQMEMIASMSSDMVTIERNQIAQASLLTETTKRLDELDKKVETIGDWHPSQPGSTVSVTAIRKKEGRNASRIEYLRFSKNAAANLIQDAIRSKAIPSVSWPNPSPYARGETVIGAYLGEVNEFIRKATTSGVH